MYWSASACSVISIAGRKQSTVSWRVFSFRVEWGHGVFSKQRRNKSLYSDVLRRCAIHAGKLRRYALSVIRAQFAASQYLRMPLMRACRQNMSPNMSP